MQIFISSETNTFHSLPAEHFFLILYKDKSSPIFHIDVANITNLADFHVRF